MSKPQAPRSRNSGASARPERASREGGASQERDGRLFFSRGRRTELSTPAASPARRASADHEDAPQRVQRSKVDVRGERPDNREPYAGRRNERGADSSPRSGAAQNDAQSQRDGYVHRAAQGQRGSYASRDEQNARGGYAQREGQGQRGSYASRDEQNARGGYAQREGQGQRGSYASRDEQNARGGYAQREGQGQRGSYASRDEQNARGGYAQREGQGQRGSYASRDEQKTRGGYAPRGDNPRGGQAQRGYVARDEQPRGAYAQRVADARRDVSEPQDEHAGQGATYTPREPFVYDSTARTPRGSNERRGGTGRAHSKPAEIDYLRTPIATIRIGQVQQVLGEILQWRFAADATLSHWMRSHRELGIRDRSEVAEAVYDVLRHLRRYRQLGESGVGAASRRLAIQGLAATVGAAALSEGLGAEEKEWLQRVSGIDLATLPRAVRYSMPDWLDERLGRMESPDTLADALNRQASLDIRVNPLKVERDVMLADLIEGPGARCEPVATPYSPWGIRLTGRPSVNRWPQFEDGRIEVQDEGSQLLALLVGPRRGEMIIDFCAGAGGKTLLLGALMRSTGRLYALDVSAARLARAKPRFARSGLSNIVPVAIESENDARIKRLAGKAQRVLVDAPCSGVGTLRRNPDLKWRQHPEALLELCDLQARILRNAARCVAPGGRLVYATCSLLAEENEEQARKFLETHPDFELLNAADILANRCENLSLTGPYMQLRPDWHGTDGFFAAVFERKKIAAQAKPDAQEQTVVAAATPQAIEPAGAVVAEEPIATELPDAEQAPAV